MATKITLNQAAPEIGLYNEVISEVLFEDGMGKGAVNSEALNFQVYVMMGQNTPDHRLDKITPKAVKMVDCHPHIQYKKSWYPLTGIPATSCDMRSLLPAIIVGY